MKPRIAPGLLALAACWLIVHPTRAQTWSRPPEDKGEVAPAPLPVEVPPDDANLHYSGRFERANPKEAVCAWPATAVTARFRGTAINVRLGTGANRFEAVVDGVPVKILTSASAAPQHAAPLPSPTLYALASGLADGEHRATVRKGGRVV